MEPMRKSIPSVIGKVGEDSPVAELTWECIKGEKGDFRGIPFIRQGCGLIEPRRMPTGRYMRRQCQCEDQALMRYREAQERHMWMTQQGSKVFNWIGGGRFADDELRKKFFGNFEQERQEEAFEAAKLFTSLLSGAFILHGTYGTGKTHLLAAICNALLERQIAARFITAPKLFAAIQSYIQSNDDYQSVVRQAIHTPLLVIDDVDKAKHTDFREEIYFEIVDERVKKGLPIALSTNRLSDLEHFVGGAVCSRLSIGQIAIEMSGADYRLEL